jgi:RHS repeat-associated protein
MLTYSYEVVDRVTAIHNGPVSNGDAYASSFRYACHGMPTSMQLGNGLWESTAFTLQLQVQSRSLGHAQNGSDLWSIQNDYHAAAHTNNGNLWSQTIHPNVSTMLVDYFTYDGANRLALATENPTSSGNLICPDAGSQWRQQFSYDPFGDRTVARQSNTTGDNRNEDSSWTVSSISTATNRNLPSVTWGYDSGGNITQDATGDVFLFDAETRQIVYCTSGVAGGCVDQAGPGRVLYGYDGDGRRVTRIDPSGVETTFVYGPDGELALEYSAAPVGSTGRQYLTADQLGSTRIVTTSVGAVAERDDQLPFGAFVPTTMVRSGVAGYGVDSGERIKFTGKERDAWGESQLDYFGTRWLSSLQMRFLSPDDPFVDQDPSKPQSWNLYNYVRNNPLTFVDPSGQECVKLDNGTQGDDGKGSPCPDAKLGTSDTVEVGVGWDDARLLMLAGVGQNLSSPHQIATVVGGGIKDAASVFAPLASMAVDSVSWLQRHLVSGGVASVSMAGIVGGSTPVLKGQAGVKQAVQELQAAGYKIIGTNVSIDTKKGVRIVADIVGEDSSTGQKVLFIAEIKNGEFAGFTANQIISGLSEGADITGVVKGLKGGLELQAGTIENFVTFVWRYLR